MRTLSLVVLALAIQIMGAAAWAGTIKEADYPVQYEILETAKSVGFSVQKDCSMTLRDPGQPKVVINVWRKGYGACHVLEPGKKYRGRQDQKKNEIELVIPVNQGKARVEDWQIIGIVGVDPNEGPGTK